MSFIGMLGAQVGAGVASSASEYFQRGADKVFGIDRKQEQIDQQRKLQELQIQGNKNMLDYSSMKQREMWDYTNYSNQRKHMEEAGLNPAMMYGMSGGGGTTVGNPSGSVNGGTASTDSQLRANEIASQGMALQLAKLQSEIKVNESIANKNNAESQTTNESRPAIVENLNQMGIGKYLENTVNEWKISGNSSLMENLGYNGSGKGLSVELSKDAFMPKEAAVGLLKAEAEAGNANANALLSNEKAKTVWGEYLNSVAHADADMIKAKAQELMTDYLTGNVVNWKSILEMGFNGVNSLSKLVPGIGSLFGK